MKQQLILSEDVDVNIQIEHEVNGQKQAMVYILRAANRKTFREIHRPRQSRLPLQEHPKRANVVRISRKN